MHVALWSRGDTTSWPSLMPSADLPEACSCGTPGTVDWNKGSRMTSRRRGMVANRRRKTDKVGAGGVHPVPCSKF